jgi:hypothetical protein
MYGRQGDPIYTQADWSGIGGRIAQALGFIGAPSQSQQPSPFRPALQPQAQPLPVPRPVPLIPLALQQAPLPPSRPAANFTPSPMSVPPAAPMPPPRPVQATAPPPPAAPNATALQAAASIPVNLPSPKPADNSAALANAVNLPPAAPNYFDQFDAPSAPNASPLAAAASIPVNLPAPVSSASSAPATADDGDGPWMDYRAVQPQPAAVTRDPWERSTPHVATAQTDEEGPWTMYQRSLAPEVTRDPWERPAPNFFDQFDAQPASPVPTAQNGPRAWGQASNLDDPYANSSLADSAAAIGRTADNAVRNVVDGATLGFGPRIAALGDAATGLSPDYSTARAAEQAQSAKAMAQSPGGVGTAEQLIGTALPAGAVARAAALVGDAAGAIPYLGRIAASPFAQATATGATVGGVNAAGNGQDPVTGAILGAGAGAAGSTLARGVGALARAATPSAAVAPSTQDLKAAAQAAYGGAFAPGHVIDPAALQRLSGAIKTTMAANAFDPALHPGGMAVVNRIAAFPQPGATANPGELANAGATLQGLDNLRRVAGLMGEGGPSAGRLGGLVQGQIDQFVNGLSRNDIVGASDPVAAAASLNNARAAWQTYSKASDLDNAVAAARAKGDMALIPGSTVDAATRNAVAKLRDSRASWSQDELQALNEVAKGSPTQRALRVVGALAPNSPITALMHAGGLIGGLATGGVGTAGSLGTMATGWPPRPRQTSSRLPRSIRLGI